MPYEKAISLLRRFYPTGIPVSDYEKIGIIFEELAFTGPSIRKTLAAVTAPPSPRGPGRSGRPRRRRIETQPSTNGGPAPESMTQRIRDRLASGAATAQELITELHIPEKSVYPLLARSGAVAVGEKDNHKLYGLQT
jgi:hypothetical protein